MLLFILNFTKKQLTAVNIIDIKIVTLQYGVRISSV